MVGDTGQFFISSTKMVFIILTATAVSWCESGDDGRAEEATTLVLSLGFDLKVAVHYPFRPFIMTCDGESDVYGPRIASGIPMTETKSMICGQRWWRRAIQNTFTPNPFRCNHPRVSISISSHFIIRVGVVSTFTLLLRHRKGWKLLKHIEHTSNQLTVNQFIWNCFCGLDMVMHMDRVSNYLSAIPLSITHVYFIGILLRADWLAGWCLSLVAEGVVEPVKVKTNRHRLVMTWWHI